mmetsp:Transcript_54949/g.112203  ORF Transcript_54949/g.112203 Transcript_54949/m.112203 type:complete len:903 (+) Transcript_54949:99-2807(+)|eukprot:CAMPEP_0181308538 /NCGR_PEP_ID=MMETSP1101-20121128/11521_1 /TAXON_ID=46948 /ORGANISM="Rhodomonas abbreviata, Strain Caron Lab Isolate" /LENGTH=902 /DNA_ID=CAMNT_0023414937 /DNA_START=95 /DNA_END=2803 /DNA_ORIENTATION=+
MAAILKFRHHDSHTLKCAAVLASIKDDTVWEKVPLCIPMEGTPLLSSPDGSSVFGSNAVCRLILAKQGDKPAEVGATAVIGPNHATEGKFIEEWLESSENALEQSGLKWLSELGFGLPETAAAKADTIAFLTKLEGTCAGKRGSLLFSALSLADISIWSALYPALASGGLLPQEEKAKYPAVCEWFELVGETQPCKDAVVKLRWPAPKSLLIPGKPKDASAEQYYITTAINYTNGNPHMGHAYEAVMSDILARWHRVYGRQVFYLTGTDEHGQKIAQTAEGLGMKPIEICDKYADAFQQLNKRLNVSNDFYIRTTMDQHKKCAQALFVRAIEKGDIYLDTYEGWYNVREETFVTENEAQMSDYKDPSSGVPLTKMTEESYFFRMSKYQEKLLAHIEANPEFVQPSYRKNEILAKLKEPLRDLSVSRTTFDWGVPLPEHPFLKSEKKHVMYVWFDALTNYVSGTGWPDGPNAKFWPAACHLIGKDIIWFHCVIWPCMLMSCDLPLAKAVFAHGFINDKEGKKMSKSLGNVIDPHEQLDKFSCDSFRFYLAYASPFGQDIPFSEEGLALMHNSELADSLGNLMHRATNITQKYCDGKVPDVEALASFDVLRLISESATAFEDNRLQDAAMCALQAVKDTNKFLTEMAPWHIKADEAKGVSEADAAKKRQVVCRSVCDAMYILAHFLAPFIPEGVAKIFDKLSTPAIPITALSPAFDNLKPGTPIKVGEVLYTKVEKAVAVVKTIFPVDIRVGKIESVEEHPSSDTLFVVQVNMGDAGVKQLCAGLRGKYEAGELVGRLVCVLLNLKPAEFKGVKSDGMMLVGDQQKPQKLQGLLAPDPSVAPGTKVEAEGADTEVVADMDLKVFQKLELKVLEGLQVKYKRVHSLLAAGKPIVAERVKENSNVR